MGRSKARHIIIVFLLYEPMSYDLGDGNVRIIEVSKRVHRGAVLISAIVFLVVISFMVAGIGTLSVSHYARVYTDANYAAALDIAEAGINFDLNKLTNNKLLADQVTVSNPSGVSYTFGRGAFKVYCTNKDGTTPWTTLSNSLYVVSQGTVNGVSRTIKVSSKSTTSSSNYALYAVKSALWSSLGYVVGNVGTNGSFSSSSGVNVIGAIDLNGGGPIKADHSLPRRPRLTLSPLFGHMFTTSRWQSFP